MASYHLSVKTVKRSAGRTATASAAYRAGERICCDREGREHDYTRKQGIEDTFILAPFDAPDWAHDRSALWNAAEARETRRNSVTAREWEVALPAELSPEARSEVVREFAQGLVDRYGVVADVAVHAPHRDGDQRNHHAHILTTTRVVGAEGFADKTRVLDAAQTGGIEIADMRGVWGDLQNRALEREGRGERVDHRSLEDQREAALERGDDLAAMALDRAPEIKLGPAANAMERQAAQEAEIDGLTYEPITQRGAQNHAIRERRDLLFDLRQRAELARASYTDARDHDASRFMAAVEAAKAMFASPSLDEFGAGFSAAWQRDEDAKQHDLAREREQHRLQQLEVERQGFVEDTAQAWEVSRQISDPDDKKLRQAALVDRVKDAAEAYGTGFDELADPINDRANVIRNERKDREESERVREKAERGGNERGENDHENRRERPRPQTQTRDRDDGPER